MKKTKDIISVPYFLRLDIRTPARKDFDYAKENYIHGRGKKKVTLMKSLTYTVAKLNIISKFEDQ